MSILTQHKLRQTAPRLAVLGVFQQAQAALSQPEIEEQLQDSCDRVTIYRTLAAFLEHGIIHKVLDDAGASKYALCAHDCGHQQAHQHDHVHFKCSQCGQTRCLDGVDVPAFQLPQGFRTQETNVLIQGVCAECAG